MPSSTHALCPLVRHSRVRRGVAGALVGAGLATTACLDEGLVKQPELTIIPGTPAGWVGTANSLAIGITISDVQSGVNAAYLSNAFQATFNSHRLVQYVRADDFRGKRVRLSAWVRPRNVGSAAVSGIFMRVDGPGVALEADDMIRRIVVGAGTWRQVSVVLDVPERAVGISLGAVFQAANTLLVDDMQFEIVGTEVASTNTLTAPIPNGLDSVGTVDLYARSPRAPLNLDFEGLPTLAGTTSNWIVQNATTLSSSDPEAPDTDLAAFDTLVGSATVVGLGDGTHGTREFQRLRHRLSRRLVSSLGFTTVAVDAPASETEALNVWVQGGSGDVPRLLSRLYEWNLNTQEFRDFVTWLRSWNVSAPPAQRVHLVGLDVLYPGASMDSVSAFVHRVAPIFDADIAVWYQCIEVFRNRGSTAGRPRSEYAVIPVDLKALCAEGINDALNLVTTRGVGAPGYQSAVRDARLVKQFEAVASSTSANAAVRARDRALAENVLAIRALRGPNERIVLWAHNDRISRQRGGLGEALHLELGAAYRPLAFAFGSGRFNAQLQQGNSVGSPQSFTVQNVPTGSLEEALRATNVPILLLDTRRIPGGGSAAAPLAGPLAMRSVGLGYNPNTDASTFVARLFPGDFDLLVFVRETTNTTLLQSTE